MGGASAVREEPKAISESAHAHVSRHWLYSLTCSPRPGAHLATAHVAGDQRPAGGAHRVRQGEGRRLGVVAEHALASPKYDGTSHEPKLVHQPGCEQLAHHIAATLRQ